jgi:Ribbon-helix-helix protein, copG family
MGIVILWGLAMVALLPGLLWLEPVGSWRFPSARHFAIRYSDATVNRIVQVTLYEMGRPPISDKAASLYAMRLPDELIAELDAYAEREGIENRSEAVRRLLWQALAAAKKRAKRKGGKREGGT